MSRPRILLAIAMALCTTVASGQTFRDPPHIGYLFPAGGQQGTTVRVIAGGQYLRGAQDVYMTGEGVQATVVEYAAPLKQNDLRDIARHIQNAILTQVAKSGANTDASAPRTKQEEPIAELPDHPLLRGLKDKSILELVYLRDQLFDSKRQLNAQIAEWVIVDIKIAADAPPGDRELRLRNGGGLTNPMVFQVGLIPEVREQEPNEPGASERPAVMKAPPPPVFDLPVVINGQIKPGDIDRLRFAAKQGQQLVIETSARHLVPYLADAVPGWFQATVALYDTNGKELAFADDYRFDPDPVLFFKVPKDGHYQLEIRDSIYRGREDFVYRVSIGEQPFITSMFPLGAKTGEKTLASITGWNLPCERVTLDTTPGPDEIREAFWQSENWVLNRLPYAVDSLPECDEAEPNDTAGDPQQVELPQIINGRIGKPGDVDVFSFEGRAGEQVVAEVLGRRLHSPIDAFLRLTTASGKTVAWNDDYMEKDGDLHLGEGLLTHHADPYLRARLPEDGKYCIKLIDIQNQGGDDFGYRLRISPPQPDFALRVTPSSIVIPAGRTMPVWVHALRKDGFDGDIDLELENTPLGFALHGGCVPAGRDCVRVTLTAPSQGGLNPFPLQLNGSAWVGAERISHPAVPADDVMQAFLWRHLVPAQRFMVSVTGSGMVPAVRLSENARTKIPAGGATIVRISSPRPAALQALKLELRDPPKGVTLQNVRVVPEGVGLVLAAEADAPGIGYADNLIIEAVMDIERKQNNQAAKKQKIRVPMGVLPAITFEVVQG